MPKRDSLASTFGRRALLGGAAGWLLASRLTSAREYTGLPVWDPNDSEPPVPVQPGRWRFFPPEEGSAVEALVDRLIPPDPQWAGGKDTGCAVFIDRQLAGPFGDS